MTEERYWLEGVARYGIGVDDTVGLAPVPGVAVKIGRLRRTLFGVSSGRPDTKGEGRRWSRRLTDKDALGGGGEEGEVEEAAPVEWSLLVGVIIKTP